MSRLWLLAVGLTAALAGSAPAADIAWEKTRLDPVFRSEGVAVADVNNDGKKDVLVGEFWYEAPSWKRHEMQTPGDYAELVKVNEGKHGYAKVFACWAEDFNKDGFADLLVVGFPGEPAYWLENPKGQGTKSDGSPTHWAKHIVWHSACNETPLYTDLLGNGRRVLVMGFQPAGKPTTASEGQMAYFTPNAADPNAAWDMHPISEPSVAPEMKDKKPVAGTGKVIPGTGRFSHGLGVGDLNGDGKQDVIVTDGWWEQPSNPDGATPWRFHPAKLGQAAADMYAYDVDGDGKNDVLSTSAHKFGIWWHKQRPASSPSGDPSFQTFDLFKDLISETHAAWFIDIDGDGLKDLVTGKRKYSHGRSEPGSDKSPAIYWLKAAKGSDGVTTFTPMTIDEDSGIGTQFEVTDINGDGLLDIVTSNKSGVQVIVQKRK